MLELIWRRCIGVILPLTSTFLLDSSRCFRDSPTCFPTLGGVRVPICPTAGFACLADSRIYSGIEPYPLQRALTALSTQKVSNWNFINISRFLFSVKERCGKSCERGHTLEAQNNQRAWRISVLELSLTNNCN